MSSQLLSWTVLSCIVFSAYAALIVKNDECDLNIPSSEMELFDNNHYANFEYILHGGVPEDLMFSYKKENDHVIITRFNSLQDNTAEQVVFLRDDYVLKYKKSANSVESCIKCRNFEAFKTAAMLVKRRMDQIERYNLPDQSSNAKNFIEDAKVVISTEKEEGLYKKIHYEYKGLTNFTINFDIQVPENVFELPQVCKNILP